MFICGTLEGSPAGGPEAKATETIESKMRFTRSKCNTVRRLGTSMQAQITFSTKIDVLTVS